MNRICPTLITPKSSWMISKMQKIFILWQSLPGTILQKTFQQWGEILSISLQNTLFYFTTELDMLHVLVFQVPIIITDVLLKKNIVYLWKSIKFCISPFISTSGFYWMRTGIQWKGSRVWTNIGVKQLLQISDRCTFLPILPPLLLHICVHYNNHLNLQSIK